MIMKVMYIYEKTNTNLMRDPIQDVDIEMGHNEKPAP